MDLRDYANNLIDNIQYRYLPKESVDIIEFLTSSEFLNEDPTPFQRVASKVLYNLWDKYPPDREEEDILKILKNKWGIDLLKDKREPKVLVLVLGRRSTKSTLASFFATYSAYLLITKGNPQHYYGIRERHDIFIVHVAASGNQAADMFSLTKNNIKKCKFFEPYIDFEKDNTTDLGLFTPYDLWLNDLIRKRNSMRSRGQPKENLLRGSITIKSITTSAATHRGEAIYLLILSEFAHFPRAKMMEYSLRETSVNLRSDYEIYKALSPSVFDFYDGKIILESTPLEKGGEFYRHYCLAGGIQQDVKLYEPDPNYKLIQLATWEARPGITREDLEAEYQRDPVAADNEWGANFLSPVSNYMTEDLIESVIDPNHKKILSCDYLFPYKFVISVDPGGSAKVKEADTYMVAWGHAEMQDDVVIYYIDGMVGWDVRVENNNGDIVKIPVNPFDVLDFIENLYNNLCRKVHFVCYDQWQDQASLFYLNSKGINAIETTFTNKYKSEMYGTFLQLVQSGRVRMYSDVDQWVDRWKLEMKYLKKIVSGGTVYYGHPTSGPVQHDDAADCVANLVYQLSLLNEPTDKSIRYYSNKNVFVSINKKVVKPLKVNNLHSIGATYIDKLITRRLR